MDSWDKPKWFPLSSSESELKSNFETYSQRNPSSFIGNQNLSAKSLTQVFDSFRKFIERNRTVDRTNTVFLCNRNFLSHSLREREIDFSCSVSGCWPSVSGQNRVHRIIGILKINRCSPLIIIGDFLCQRICIAKRHLRCENTKWTSKWSLRFGEMIATDSLL